MRNTTSRSSCRPVGRVIRCCPNNGRRRFVRLITGKLALIKLDIGHVAGVDAIYDAEKDELVYCESVHYAVEIEPAGLANGRQP